MELGDEQEVVFAIVWSRGNDRLDSVRQLREDVRHLRSVTENLLQPSVDAIQSPPADPALGFAENYPNPFSGTTTIRYSVPQIMNVRLAVFDGLGREVALLSRGVHQPGEYEVQFDAEKLPSGIYLSRIEMDHLVFYRRMVVVR
jgi:hypothetical protein